MTLPTVEATQVYNQTSNASTTGAQTLSLGTISEGDIIFVFCSLDGTAGAPTGSGNNSGSMTAIQNTDEGNNEVEVLYAVQGATADTTITVSWTGSEQGRFMYVRVASADSTPINATGTGSTGAGTSVTPTSPASTVDNCLFLAICGVDRDQVDAADTVSGTGWTEVGTSGSSGGANGSGLIVAELDQTTAGTPANPAFSSWTSDSYAAYVFAVEEVQAAAASTYREFKSLYELINGSAG